MSFLAAIDREISDLERKLTALKTARAAYAGEAAPVRSTVASEQAAPPAPQVVTKAVTDVSLRQPRRTEYGTKVLDYAKAYIELHGGPVPTAELYRALDAAGIEVRGQKPQNALSALLSNSGMFKANGRDGWTLLENGPTTNTEAASAFSLSKDAPAASFEPRLTSEGTHPSSPVEPWAGGGT